MGLKEIFGLDEVSSLEWEKDLQEKYNMKIRKLKEGIRSRRRVTTSGFLLGKIDPLVFRLKYLPGMKKRLKGVQKSLDESRKKEVKLKQRIKLKKLI